MEDWEKELRRKRKLDSLIINRPEALNNIRRKTELSITALGWIVWIFLCRPALLLILWLMGFRFFFRHMIDLSGLVGLQEVKLIYISIIIIIFMLVRGWNMYNKVRYGKKKRRVFVRSVDGDRLEECFQLPKNSASKLQNMREVDIDFLKDHQIQIQDPEKPKDLINGYFKPT